MLGLTALGSGSAATVEYFSRRFVKSLHLLADGRHIVIEYHSAYFRNKTEDII